MNGTGRPLSFPQTRKSLLRFDIERIFRYLRTVRYLRPKQILYYFIRRVVKLSTVPSEPAAVRLRNISILEPLCLSEPVPAQHVFMFLNECRDKNTEPFDWTAAGMSKLWRYHLHYFDYLLDKSRLPEYRLYLVNDWIEQNPPGQEDAWEPYTISLRIVNWIKFYLMNRVLEPESDKLLASLYRQALWLEKNIEHHILANHYLKNGVALFFAGYFFKGADAKRWLRKGSRIIGRQMEEQFLDDGGHYERSLMYHSITVIDLLDIANLVLCNYYSDTDFTGRLKNKIIKALDFLCTMRMPDGGIPLFNDAALNMVPEPDRIFSYAKRVLGYSDQKIRAGFQIEQHPQSGYYIARNGADCLIIDCGEIGPSYQPGHAHCDTLSYELVLNGARVVVDSGVHDYENGWRRTYCRSTWAHNTVAIDGRDQSEMWGAFRVGRRAKPVQARMQWHGDHCIFEGTHDGYRNLPGNVLHSRNIRFDHYGKLSVVDSIMGAGVHTVESFIHMHPDFRLKQDGSRIRVLDKRDVTVMEVVPGGAAKIDIVPSKYFPEFGKEFCNSCIVLSAHDSLPLQISYQIQIADRNYRLEKNDGDSK
jgi:uncharacterized heparinase superfamily protein